MSQKFLCTKYYISYLLSIFELQESAKLARNKIIDSQRKLRRIPRNLQPGLDQPSTSRDSYDLPVTSEYFTPPYIDDLPQKKNLIKIIAKLSKTSLRRLRKLKTLQQMCRRLKRKISSLETLVSQLKIQNLLNDEDTQIIVIGSTGEENEFG